MSMPKPPHEWNKEDLLALIRDQVEESYDLEYKRCAALQKRDEQKREVSKDVSAMANAAGGTILYGMIEEKRVPTELDAGFDPTDITKEWLEHVIMGGIRPRLNGVVIHPIPLSTHASGKVAYLVYVPQSFTAHQAADKKYYRRFNFESVPMEDYEIRDVMNRQKHPVLIPNFTRRHIANTETTTEFLLFVSLKNVGVVRATDIKLIITIPRTMSKSVHGLGQRSIQLESRIFGNGWFENTLKTSNHIIFPDDEWSINEASANLILLFDTKRVDVDERREPFLYWKVFANDMTPMSGSVFLGDVPIV